MRYDVVVVGGGLVGLTLAVALVRDGIRVALVEARERDHAPRQAPRQGFDLRTSAITPVSRRILTALGAWQRLDPARATPFERMRVWDRDVRHELCFDAADADLAVLGHLLENAELIDALEAVAGELDALSVYRPARVETLEAGTHGIGVGLDSTRVEARLVVGADGAGSRVRSLAGIEARVAPYERDALVATVRTAGGHQNTAWQRFLPAGPLAFLPLPDGWSSVVWSTHPGHAAELEACAEQALANALTDAFEARLGPVREVAARGRFPLTRVEARRYLTHRIALVGDAAHTIHPLAGQGVNLGLLDAAVLAERIAALIRAGRDPGLEGNLRPYERWRRGHNLLTGEIMTGFHHLFGSSLPPVAMGRNLGFALTNRSATLKRAFIRYASGFAFELPEIARRAHTVGA